MKLKEQGFTLVEMCIVLVLIGVICVAVIPATSIVRRQEAKKFASELCFDISLMRQQSIASGIANTLTLTQVGAGTGKNSYEFSKGLRTADSQERLKAQVNCQKIEVVMQGANQAGDITESNLESITFLGNKATKLTDGSGEAIPKLLIMVTNKEQQVKVEYDTLTGHYEISIV